MVANLAGIKEEHVHPAMAGQEMEGRRWVKVGLVGRHKMLKLGLDDGVPLSAALRVVLLAQQLVHLVQVQL